MMVRYRSRIGTDRDLVSSRSAGQNRRSQPPRGVLEQYKPLKSYDALIIGGGMAGVSLGYELSADRSVGLLEMETTLAFHTTGRSAARSWKATAALRSGR